MIDALLGPWKWLAYAVVIAVAVGGAYAIKVRYDNEKIEQGAKPWRDKFNALAGDVKKQKAEATDLLTSETAKAQKVTQGWIDYSRKADDEHAKKVAGIRNASVGGGLYDPAARRWQSSNCPATSKSSTGTPENTAERSRLSGVAEQFLYSEAKRADEVAEYAMSCYRYVNELEPQ